MNYTLLLAATEGGSTEQLRCNRATQISPVPTTFGFLRIAKRFKTGRLLTVRHAIREMLEDIAR
jgi:hypothetical protein